MSKKGHKTFYRGKGVVGEGNSPLTGVPNTILNTYSKLTGKIVQSRRYDSNGSAILDLDAGHQSHKNKNDHAHDFVSGKRQEGRPFYPKEEKQFNKAKRKRRFRTK